MIIYRKLLSLLFLLVVTVSCGQEIDADYFKDNYDVQEYRIPMRDGIELFTIVYTPKDQKEKYPILMNRTCYNASRHANYEYGGYPSKYLVEDGTFLFFKMYVGDTCRAERLIICDPTSPETSLETKRILTKAAILMIPSIG